MGGHALMTKHRHHLIPKYLGGTDDEENMTPPISVAMHVKFHEDLYEQFGRVEDKYVLNFLRAERDGKIDREAIAKNTREHNLARSDEFWKENGKRVSASLKANGNMPEAAKRGWANRSSARTCPHCGFEGKAPNIYQYHFKKCKSLTH